MKKAYSAPISTQMTFQVEGMLATSQLKTIDNEENFGGSSALSNKDQQSSSSIWSNMNTDE